MPDDWTAPGAYEVAPGIHRLPLPLPNDGLRAVNVYALTGGPELTLVDSGWALAVAEQQLAAGLAVLGAELGDVRRFLVTHVHRDHYTLAVALRARFGGHVSLGLGEQPTLRRVLDPAHRPLDGQLAILRRAGAHVVANTIAAAHRRSPTSDESCWDLPDAWISDGEQFTVAGRQLTALATPGHTAGHVVFDDPAAGALFAGDHVLSRITPSIGLEAAPTDNPLGAFLASLRMLLSRPDRLLLPAHGPVGDSVHNRVHELLDHHGRRLEQALAALAAGADTAYAVAGVLRWTRREHALADLDPFNAMLAVGETAAHLDLLVARGQIHRELRAGVAHYAV